MYPLDRVRLFGHDALDGAQARLAARSHPDFIVTRPMIVQRLHEIQKRDPDRYLKREEMERLVLELRAWDPTIKLRHIHEVASFFPHFRLEPPPKVEVDVCRDMACHMNGAGLMLGTLRQRLGQLAGRDVHVTAVSCLGQCDRPPAVRVNDVGCGLRQPEELIALVMDLLSGRVSNEAIPRLRPGPPPDWELDFYKGEPTYSVAREYAKAPDPQGVLKTLERANLLGLGGPGQRSWMKWDDVLQQTADVKYIVCNGDESEPGTFKDREILLHAPHLVIEGMLVAGMVVGARRGFIYIRHEFEDQIEACRAAIRRAYDLGVLGDPAPRTNQSFHLEVFVSPGGYICGEMTALIEAMEDRRGEPRNRPPELQVKGLHQKPTVVNNVETLAWVPYILRDNAETYVKDGVNGSQGRRLFSISGDVAVPGVYEVAIGSTLGALIERAGGLTHGLKAVATSGPSGGFLPAKVPAKDLPRGLRDRLAKRNRPLAQKLTDEAPDLDVLDLELDIPLFRDVNYSLGAAIVVFGEHRDMPDMAVSISRFFRAESCGKCVPCRLGTQRVTAMAEELATRQRGSAQAITASARLVPILKQTMSEASICGLGQVAANALESTLRYFRADYLKTNRQ